MQKRVLVVHGYGSSPNAGWKPWLKEELEKRKFSVFMPQMPGQMRPKLEKWVDVISKLVGKPDMQTYLVGHSIGAVAVPRYLETLKDGERIGGAVLLAGFTDDLGHEVLRNFFPRPLDYGKIRAHCGKIIAIHSDNDYYVDLRHGAEFIVMRNHLHFSSADGFTKLPVLLESILEVAGEKY